jgi:glutamate dehydrogenase
MPEITWNPVLDPRDPMKDDPRKIMKVVPTKADPEIKGRADWIHEISADFARVAEEVVPWFLERMPPAYLQDADPATLKSHMTAVLAAKASDTPIRLTLKSEGGAVWTFIHEGNYPGLLAKLVRQLPPERPLRSAKVYTAKDGQLALDVFRFSESQVVEPVADIELENKKAEVLAFAKEQDESVDLESLARHLDRCAHDYLRSIAPFNLYRNWRLIQRTIDTDDTVVELRELSPAFDIGLRRICVASGNVEARFLFERIVRYFGHKKLDIRRAYLDVFDDGGSSVALFSMVLPREDAARLPPKSEAWLSMQRDLGRIRWIDRQALRLAFDEEGGTLFQAEVMVALSNLCHARLAREDSYAYSRERLYMFVERHEKVATQLHRLFEARFHPKPDPDASVEAATTAVRRTIEQEVDDDKAAHFFDVMIEAIASILATNAYVDTRYGLAFRIGPKFMASCHRDGDPYGVFFVHSRTCDAFHVRFRDVARGGVRVVCPAGKEQHAIETERLYVEVYGLAFAQQLKNKDIPEGGAKAVILLRPGLQVDQGVKSFVNSLLDLLCDDPAVQAKIRRYGPEGELIYLGPDENISPRLIDWVVERATQRGYPTPQAFMSSKADVGINHKTYGVTSEGVTVFLEEALREAGIAPGRDSFTVKLTGGPDGDVAGNELRILHREFGENARIVGIADGSGSAEDPDGLAWDVLLDLVAREQPIAAFDRARLGARGRVVRVHDADGLKMRNSLHNRVVADAFIPAGGRPGSIHEGNWKLFLTDDGQPSSRVIVEGANLFLTPGARAALSKEAGVIIVKDSSANKCGVICSSFEILAGMLLSSEEFIELKDRFVEQVLVRLRALARQEARLLFREHRRSPQIALPEMSGEISRLMIRATDAIEASLAEEPAKDEPLVRAVVQEHLPPVLWERAQDRLGRLPPAYFRGMVASSLAGRIVYREGLAYLSQLPGSEIAELAWRYLRQEEETRALVHTVESSNLPGRERIAALLTQGGTQAGVALESEAFQRK